MLMRAVSIVLAGLLIALAILIVFRWQISSATSGSVFRLDRWTGNIVICGVKDSIGGVSLVVHCYETSTEK